MYREGSPGLHASHYVGRANRVLRWSLDNVDSLCNGCHQYMETHKATLYRDWKMAQLGEDRYLALVERSRQIRKWKPDELRELQKELKALTSQ